jgi:hypothetical protein
MSILCVRVKKGNHYVHLQTFLVQSFVLLFQNFEEVVQIIALKRFGCAPHYNQLAPLSVCLTTSSGSVLQGVQRRGHETATLTSLSYKNIY